jgi:hypothetical protein
MAKCTDNTRLGRVGCGATYSGEMQHSVARVPWSEHPDGLAHITGRYTTIDVCWRKAVRGVMADPKTLDLVQNERGVWARPMRESAREWAEQKGVERALAKK